MSLFWNSWISDDGGDDCYVRVCVSCGADDAASITMEVFSLFDNLVSFIM